VRDIHSISAHIQTHNQCCYVSGYWVYAGIMSAGTRESVPRCSYWGHNSLVPPIYITPVKCAWTSCVVGKTIHQRYMATPYSTQHKEKGSSCLSMPVHRIQGPRVKPDIYALSAMDIQVASRDLAIFAHYVHDVIRMLKFSGYHGVRMLGKIEIPQGLRIRGSPKPTQRDSQQIHQACSPLNVESCNQGV
jgi:hypothetical protein